MTRGTRSMASAKSKLASVLGIPNSGARRMWDNSLAERISDWGHAAGLEAVAAGLVLLDRRDLCLHRSDEVGADQARRTASDDDQVAIEVGRLLPARMDFAQLDLLDDLLCQQGKQTQHGEGDRQAGQEDARLLRLEPGEAEVLSEAEGTERGRRRDECAGEQPARLVPVEIHGGRVGLRSAASGSCAIEVERDSHNAA
jgi:hypothetical protein